LKLTNDSKHRVEPSLDTVAPLHPNLPYDMKDVIYRVVDDGNFFEIQPSFAKNIIIGLGRMEGRTVGFVANQPLELAGVLDIDASCKAARFIRWCDSYNIPIVTFVDVPGYLPGKNQEHGGIIRHGSKLLFAYAESTVPKITVITRKAYGGAYVVMSSQHLGADRNYAWPQAEVAVMGAKGATEILFRGHKDTAEKEREYTKQLCNPIVPAEGGYIDDIILPRNTRHVICEDLEILATKKVEHPWKKRGNIAL